MFFQENSCQEKYKKTRENLSCYVKICYNYSNRGFVKGEVGDGAEFNKEEIDYEDQLRQSERERKDLKKTTARTSGRTDHGKRGK